jgi:23S rRNA pseudouridine2605 synthase
MGWLRQEALAQQSQFGFKGNWPGSSIAKRMAEVRLQKVMASAGIGSRRACERLIVEGKVRVDGKVVTELGTKVDPARAKITVNGAPIRAVKEFTYIKMHKPRGVLSDASTEPDSPRSVLDLLPEGSPRLFAVGRLDLRSEGLVLLTDDGELANRLTHPRYEHPKVYYVLVEKQPDVRTLQQLREGIELETGRTAPAQVEVVDRPPENMVLAPGPSAGVWLRMVLREGKKRQIRLMTAAVDFPTLRLLRWAIGPLTLGGLRAGESRRLSKSEIRTLRQLAGLENTRRRQS